MGTLGARWLVLCCVAVSLTGCRPEDGHPSTSNVGIAVALVLLPDRSNACCLVVSLNDEGRAIDLPVDPSRDSYRSKCRVARWHGAPPL